MSRAEIDIKSAIAAGVKGWQTFPWIYTNKRIHLKAEELNAQYANKHISTDTYIERLDGLFKTHEVSEHEYTRSLHYLYARGEIDSDSYLRKREPHRCNK
jgi:hypothetical protein